MKVKSLKTNKKLLKGVVYDAISFDNRPVGSVTGRFHRRSISVMGFGWYSVDNFTDENGNPLPQIQYQNPNIVVKPIVRNEKIELAKGDIVVCETDSFKYFVKGGKYRLTEVKELTNWSAKVKLEGYNRFITFTRWNFRKLSLQETREIALSQIFDKPENFSVDFVRKFEKQTDKTKILVECLCKTILDPNRHHYDIIDWTIVKNKYQGLEREDFTELLKMPLGEILLKIEDSTKKKI